MFGIAITTCNRSEWCKQLLNTINSIDAPVVVVNDGPAYSWKPPTSNITFIQNEHNIGIPKSKNRGILSLLANPSIDYIFTIEDDVLVKDISVFSEFIKVYQHTNLPFFTFPAHAYHVGQPGSRTPVTSVSYSDSAVVDFFPNMVASFCMFTRKLLLRGGLYDEDFGNSWFDVDLIFRYAQSRLISPFWYFPCIQEIDKYIELIPESVERSEAHERNWDIQKYGQMFTKKNGALSSVKREPVDYLKSRLLELYNG